mmetsp:Transcript_22509/g.62143  ORF Transcript_22509/g.62143 Transcript_22509/m.62143 type:complete len:240 (+) Transcript_22509:398-1117(+)
MDAAPSFLGLPMLLVHLGRQRSHAERSISSGTGSPSSSGGSSPRNSTGSSSCSAYLSSPISPSPPHVSSCAGLAPGTWILTPKRSSRNLAACFTSLRVARLGRAEGKQHSVACTWLRTSSSRECCLPGGMLCSTSISTACRSCSSMRSSSTFSTVRSCVTFFLSFLSSPAHCLSNASTLLSEMYLGFSRLRSDCHLSLNRCSSSMGTCAPSWVCSLTSEKASTMMASKKLSITKNTSSW